MILSLFRRRAPEAAAPAVPPPTASVDDQLARAKALAEAGDHDAALAIWGPLAHQGVGRAANNIAACFLDGLGVERDPALALQWLEAAAKAGDPVGQRNYATALFQGVGGTDDPAGAFEWYGKAAEAGDAQAQDMLSWMLLEGEVAPYDPAAAKAWAHKAASAGIGPSMTRLGLIFHHALGVERDAEAAVKWWTKAVEAGDADGAAMLGAAHFLGQGIERDPARALVLLILARRFGSTLADAYRPAVEAALDAPSRERASELAADIAARPPWADLEAPR